MAKNKVPKPRQDALEMGKIPTPLTTSTSTNDEKPSFRFTHVDDNKWCLSVWKATELKDLTAALKKIEKHTWAQIQSQGSKTRGESVGSGYKIITDPPKLPASVSEDVTLTEMRICKEKRIFGFRIDAIYYIVWFDRDHSVCPENKNRR